MVPVFVRSSIDGVGVIRLTLDRASESVSNSLRILSSDGIISTCGREYSASSNCFFVVVVERFKRRFSLFFIGKGGLLLIFIEKK